MNPAQTYNYFKERYGEDKGKEMFLDLCEEKADTAPFPTNLEWVEIAREILKGEL